MDINLAKQYKKVRTTDQQVLSENRQGHQPSKTKQKAQTTDTPVIPVYRHGHQPSKTKQKGTHYRQTGYICVQTRTST